MDANILKKGLKEKIGFNLMFLLFEYKKKEPLKTILINFLKGLLKK